MTKLWLIKRTDAFIGENDDNYFFCITDSTGMVDDKGSIGGFTVSAWRWIEQWQTCLITVAMVLDQRLSDC